MAKSEETMFRRFDYDRRLLPNACVAAMEEGVTSIEQALERTGRSPGYPAWNLLYYAALCSLRRERENLFVETGTNWGFSTIMLAQALRDGKLGGHVHSVEIDRGNFERAGRNIREAGLADLVTLHCGDAKAFLAEFVPSIAGAIHFVFLDGSHRQDDVVAEFDLIHPKLDDESLVFFDNTHKMRVGDADQRVNGALWIITERYGGNLVNFPNSSWSTPGEAIWQRAPFRPDWSDG